MIKLYKELIGEIVENYLESGDYGALLEDIEEKLNIQSRKDFFYNDIDNIFYIIKYTDKEKELGASDKSELTEKLLWKLAESFNSVKERWFGLVYVYVCFTYYHELEDCEGTILQPIRNGDKLIDYVWEDFVQIIHKNQPEEFAEFMQYAMNHIS